MVKNPKCLDTQTKINNTKDGDHQPNGIDLRVGKIYRYEKSEGGEDFFLLSEDIKTNRNLVEAPKNEQYFYELDSGYYLVEFENTIEVGENECGWVFPRSTLMRNGLMVYTALYDSSYNGKMCAGLGVFSPKAFIKPGSRIAQYVTLDANANGKYSGQYQGLENKII